MLRRSATHRISSFEFGHPVMPTAFGRTVYAHNPVAEAWGPVQRTKLSNGVTVVSQDRKTNITSIGIYAEAGAKFDPPAYPGLSYAMRYAQLTGNLDESLFQIDRAMRAVGAAYGNCEVNKRHIGWFAEVPRQAWQTPLSKIQSCVAVPKFAESDIERFRDAWDAQLEEQRWQQPRDYVVQKLETVAFWREPLGSPRHVEPADNDRLYAEAMLKQYCRLMAPQRITVAALNVDHSELVTTYQNLPFQLSSTAPHFKDAILEAPTATASEAAQYDTTTVREDVELEERAKWMGTQPDMENDGIYALGWLTYGADTSSKEYATALVCRAVLDGLTGDSARANRMPQHFGTRSFYKPYSSAGLIGFTLRQSSYKKGKLAHDVNEALTLLPAGKVTAADAARATNRAAVSYFHDTMETQRDALNQLATSPFTGDEVLAAIKSVTADDCNKAFNAMKAAKPCAFSTGGVADIPSLRSMLIQNKLM